MERIVLRFYRLVLFTGKPAGWFDLPRPIARPPPNPTAKNGTQKAARTVVPNAVPICEQNLYFTSHVSPLNKKSRNDEYDTLLVTSFTCRATSSSYAGASTLRTTPIANGKSWPSIIAKL